MLTPFPDKHVICKFSQQILSVLSTVVIGPPLKYNPSLSKRLLSS